MKKGLTLKMHEHIQSPEGKRKFNEHMFSEIAPRYNFITRALSFGRDTAWKNELIRYLPEIEKATCLDLASGTGDITFRLAKKYPVGRVIGLDLAEPMLDMAGKMNTFPNVEFLAGDMCQSGFADETFDIVTGGYAIRNAPVLDNVLTEIRRVIKPGGTAAFLDFSKTPNKVLQKIEIFLLKLWGGFWGLLLRHNIELYTYIGKSLKQFPDSIRLKEKIGTAGFEIVFAKKHFAGFAETIICRRLSTEPAD
ncbi:MAG: ubiquinone/menaquinone biosynthesis methyltransferase [Planctomycetota bacterium]|jgi:demethylmenaquinone methyltransferase/2-methoxy-6-polyprenyl-1,4-benzoquinol methylase